MKTIKIDLDKNSISNAIKELEEVKNQLKTTIIKDFLKKCTEFFISKAKLNVLNTEIGEQLKYQINSSWVVNEKGNNKVVILNKHKKSVYVEFGVGIAGENSHPNAKVADYNYNLDSPYKNENDRSWVFKTYDEEIDIPLQDTQYTKYVDDGVLLVLTLGTQGAMYAYNALIDLKAELPRLWEETKKRYWR